MVVKNAPRMSAHLWELLYQKMDKFIRLPAKLVVNVTEGSLDVLTYVLPSKLTVQRASIQKRFLPRRVNAVPRSNASKMGAHLGKLNAQAVVWTRRETPPTVALVDVLVDLTKYAPTAYA
jgi:hypothetical protein